MKRTKWSKEEIEYLRKLYLIDELSLTEIYPIFLEKFNRTETSINVKIKRLKLRHTKEQTKKIKQRLLCGENNPMFGKDSPNKGLTKENSERIKKMGVNVSKTKKQMFLDGLLPDISGKNNPMYGKKSWNSGLTKHTDNRLLNSGKIISQNKKNEWFLKTDEEKKIVTDRLNKAMIQNRTPTSIEVKVGEYLKSLNLNFKQNKRLHGFLIDFYIYDFNVAVECDGDYWHGNPLKYWNKTLNEMQLKNKDRDRRKNEMLNEHSIKFLRFWEFDIHNNFEMVKLEINKLLNL
jgi:very-short-patch-repair endonuclease